MLSKLYKFLTSLRFTIVLICLLGLIFIIGLWVPQKALLQTIYLEWKANSPLLVGFLDTFQLTSIYTSWVTMTLWVLFFVNLTLVLWQRIPVLRHRLAVSEAKIADPDTAPGYTFRNSYPVPPGFGSDAVLDLIRARGYPLLGDARGFYGIKNRLSPVAFWIFHISFYFILLGGIITVYTEFNAYLNLAEGERFQGDIGSYNKVPHPRMPKIGRIPRADITVKSIVPTVVGNTPTGVSVILADAEGRQHEVGINQPYKTDHTSFVFHHLGVAPLFVLKDPSGKEVDGAYFKLDVLKGKPDRFAFGNLVFKGWFYPDYIVEKGKAGTRSQEFNNPVFVIEVTRSDRKVATGTVSKNSAFEFEGYRLELQEMPFWVRFNVIRERGLSVMYFGFALATIAVIWRLVYYRREVVGAVRGEGGGLRLVVAGRSEYYKNLSEDEFTKLFETLFGSQSGAKNRQDDTPHQEG